MVAKKTRPWERWEIKYLIKNYVIHQTNYIAKHLNRTVAGVDAKAHRLKLGRDVNYWTHEAASYLKQNYNQLDINLISKKVGHSVKACQTRAYKLGFAKKKGLNYILSTQRKLKAKEMIGDG
jgi:hypothetical protein